MATIFNKIISGEIPCYKIAETEDYLAFLDIRPLAKGHTLCIPKEEVDFIFDLEDEILSGLMLFAKKVAKAVDAAMDCKRVGVMVVGTEVPHAHIHLIPFQTESQMNVKGSPIEVSADEMQKIAVAIVEKI